MNPEMHCSRRSDGIMLYSSRSDITESPCWSLRVSNMNDQLAGLNSARDLASAVGLSASAIDILKGGVFDEGMRLAAIVDPHAATARDLAGISGAMTSMVDSIKSVRGLDESMRLAIATGRNSIADPCGALNSARDLAGVSGAMASAVDALKSVHGLDESLRLAGVASVAPAMSKIARQISDQQNAIASLRPLVSEMSERFTAPEPLRLPELPPNPLHETNKRLANIEQRFNRMESIALDGAEIATGLQASAATFLIKFEKASANNDRTSGRAVWLGIAAILIAVAMTAVQILYTELWRAPADSTSQQAAITDMKSQIKDLENTQRAVADELAKVLSKSNSELTATLHDIRNLLAEQQKRTVAPPEMKR